MIYLVYFDQKSIHDVMSYKFKMRMANPRSTKFWGALPMSDVNLISGLEVIETNNLMPQ